MMGLYRSLGGKLTISCTSADLPAFFEELGRFEIACSDITAIDELTAQLSIRGSDHRKLLSICERRGARISVVSRQGIIWNLIRLWHRPILVVGLLLILLTGLYLPTRILFISVEGNDRVPDRLILETAELYGLGFWSDRREIRSEQIKNRLLGAIEELKWAGVNTYGCRAVITVRERDEPPQSEQVHRVRHIHASRDGIITSCVVTDGQALCATGQAVKAGDILISGYTDCGISIRACAAKGEVFAQTKRQMMVVTPSVSLKRSISGSGQHRYSLIIGKKRINFYKGSGISGGSCVKMYEEYVLTLPGGFRLPVKLVRETISDGSFSEAPASDASALLESFSSDYLKSQMTAGTVLRKSETISESDGVCCLTGEYDCIESIGIAQDEKIGDFNGKTDGADRERGSGG